MRKAYHEASREQLVVDIILPRHDEELPFVLLKTSECREIAVKMKTLSESDDGGIAKRMGGYADIRYLYKYCWQRSHTHGQLYQQENPTTHALASVHTTKRQWNALIFVIFLYFVIL